MSVYNIAENVTYKWTTASGRSFLNEVPRIFATSYLFKTSDVINQISTWGNAVTSTDGVKYYDNLHPVNSAVLDRWIFPYFGDDVRQISTSWSDNYVGSTNGTQGLAGMSTVGVFSKLADEIQTTIGQFQANITSPGSLFEPPKFFNYAELGEGSIGIEFSLINTIDGNYKKNYDLIKELIKINKLSRGAGLIVEPAALWRVTVPGYRYISWASANVDIKLLGQRKYIDGILVPEGYRVTVTFTSLYTEPRELEAKYSDNQGADYEEFLNRTRNGN